MWWLLNGGVRRPLLCLVLARGAWLMIMVSLCCIRSRYMFWRVRVGFMMCGRVRFNLR